MLSVMSVNDWIYLLVINSYNNHHYNQNTQYVNAQYVHDILHDAFLL